MRPSRSIELKRSRWTSFPQEATAGFSRYICPSGVPASNVVPHIEPGLADQLALRIGRVELEGQIEVAAWGIAGGELRAVGHLDLAIRIGTT